MLVNFKANAIPASFGCGNASSARAQEGIENRVTDETKHTYEAFRNLNRVGGRVITGGSACQPRPDLLKPLFVILARNHT